MQPSVLPDFMEGDGAQPKRLVELTRFAPDDPYGSSQGAAYRALEILELFAVEQRPLTVSVVCSKLGFPQSSTSVLLRGLAERGYLEHDRKQRTFQPTARVAFLGMWMNPRAANEGGLLDFMESLASASRLNVLLAKQNGLYVQYIHLIAARPSRVGLKPGLLRPICRTATGKVLLAAMGDDEVRRIARHANAVDTLYEKPIDVSALLAELEDVRSTGFSESRNGVTPGAAVIATRLPFDVGGAPLAVGIAMHTSEIDRLRASMRDLLRERLATSFGDLSIPARRVQVAAPQVGYAVVVGRMKRRAKSAR